MLGGQKPGVAGMVGEKGGGGEVKLPFKHMHNFVNYPPFMQVSNWFCISVMLVRRIRIFPFMSGSVSWANAHTCTKEKKILEWA